MKKIIPLLIMVFFFLSSISVSGKIIPKERIFYPDGKRFEQLEEIINNYLIKKPENDFVSENFIGNLKYDEIINKQIELIVLETFDGNEDFYNNLFANYFSFGAKIKVSNVLNALPKARIGIEQGMQFFDNNFVSNKLLDRSLADNSLEYLTLDQALNEINKAWGGKKIPSKDYKKLIGNKQINNIPNFYKNIPSDSIFFHVRNPKFIFDLIDSKNSSKKIGIGILEKIKDIIIENMGSKDFKYIKNNINNEFIVIVSNFDLISPDITLIINKFDEGVVTNKKLFTKNFKNWVIISTSNESLLNISELAEANSIYNSDDFRYLWLKQGEDFKDFFFFAGDKYFEKITELSNFVKSKRNFESYNNLRELQFYVLAYEKLYDIKLTSFEKLNELLNLPKQLLNSFSLDNSIVSHNQLGSLTNIKNTNDIKYKFNQVTNEELRRYFGSAFKYRKIWKSNLNPIGITINDTNNGFEIKLLMTPISGYLSEIIKIEKLKNLGIERFELLDNPKTRIGSLGILIGYNTEQLKKILTENEVFNDIANFSDHLPSELLVSFGGLPSNFESLTIDNMDIFLGSKFSDYTQANNAIEALKLLGGNQLGVFDQSLSDKLKDPIKKDYLGENYYEIPINLMFFNLTFTYTILDNFVYISLNENSIKDTIDSYKSGNNKKKKFNGNNFITGNKLIYSYIDSDAMTKNYFQFIQSDYIKNIYNDTQNNINNDSVLALNNDIAKHLNNKFNKKYFGKESQKFSRDYGLIKLNTIGDNLYIKIDKSEIKVKNEQLLKEINTLITKFDDDFFNGDGVKIEKALEDEALLNKLSTTSLFLNLNDETYVKQYLKDSSLSLDIGNNIIKLQYNVFSGKSNGDSDNKALWYGIGFLVLLTLILLIMKLKSQKTTNDINP